MRGFVNSNSTGQSSRSRKATENFFSFFFESVRQGVSKRKLADELRDLGFIVWQTDDQSNRDCSLEVIRLEAPELDFLLLKPVQESEHDDDSYLLLKNRMSASPHGSAPR